MYKIKFYADNKGREPVKEFLKSLYDKGDIMSRKRADKINKYLAVLRLSGTFIGEPYVKYLGEELWELRPARDRIIFAVCTGSEILLLHQFLKTTQKTPPKEIEIARKRLKDFKTQEELNHEK